MPQTNEQMVNYLVEKWVLHTASITSWFKKVDRANFILPEYQKTAYQDTPLPIWYEATISQPSTVAFMLELLKPNQWDKVLDIWAGSGWTTAILSHIVWKKWKVIWTEIIPQLVDFGNTNLSKYSPTNSKIILTQKELWIPWEKFDKILVSASAGNENVCEKLLDQLKNEWTIVIPIKDSIYQVHKDYEWNITSNKYYWFLFVPLR